MIRTVKKRDFHIHHGESRNHTRVHSTLNARVYSRDILLGNHTARNGIDKFITFAGLIGFHTDFHMTILSASTALTGVFGLLFHSSGNGFLIGNLRRANVRLHLELPQKAVYNDFQMEFTHTCNNGLTGFLIGIGFECGVFLCQLHQPDRHFFLTGFGLRFNGYPDNRFRKFHGFQNNRGFFITKSISGSGALQPDGGFNVSREHFFNVFTVVGVHLQNASNPFTDTFGTVQNRGAGGQMPGVHTEKAQSPDIRVCHDFERKRGKRSLVISGTGIFFTGFGIFTPDCGNVQRGRQIIYNGVQQFLYTFVAVGRAARNRNHGIFHSCLPDCRTNAFRSNFHAFQHILHNGVIHHGNGVQKGFPVAADQFLHFRRNGFHPHIFSEVIVINIGVHLHQIDNAPEGVFFSDGKLNGYRTAFQTVFHHVQYVVKIRAHNVHFVDVNHTGDAVTVGLAPYGFRLGFHAALGAQYGHTAVQYAQRAFHLHGKIHVTGGIDNVDAGRRILIVRAGPVTGGCG